MDSSFLSGGRAVKNEEFSGEEIRLRMLREGLVRQRSDFFDGNLQINSLAQTNDHYSEGQRDGWQLFPIQGWLPKAIQA
jgi:hypothetical protein